MMPRDALPIDAVLPDLLASLRTHHRAVLIAPPGAGKTTYVPLALMEENWARDQRIIMLEPRRLAARAAAARMATLTQDDIGGVIGVRMRMDTQVSARTRVEIVTEGVFARMILDDPMLEGICAVIFDEFHERSLDADLGLALALDAQMGLRPDLRLIIMSATLDGARIAALMDDAPIIESEGKMFPIATHYVGRDPALRLEDDVVRVIMRAVREEHGSLLVFLPGQAEITRTTKVLTDKIDDERIDIVPLYGTLDKVAQERALMPSAHGRRKIVLATSIAESSLTIDGVRIVVDCGLARVPVYENDIGLTRLDTVRVSRASADQRRGRAGRIETGVCYRMWEEAANASLPAFTTPEILNADLSGLVLDLCAWGVRDPASLTWLDPPPAAALSAAHTLLDMLCAWDEDGRLNAQGAALRRLPLPPRLARMVLEGARHGQAETSAALAALLVERGLGGDHIDLSERMTLWQRERGTRATHARAMARTWARLARELVGTTNAAKLMTLSADDYGALLFFAFPDRIAKARGGAMLGEFVMSNGRAGVMAPHEILAQSPYIIIADLTGRAVRARITSAVALDQAHLDRLAAHFGRIDDEISFDAASQSVRARRNKRIGSLILSQHPLTVPATLQSARILAHGLVDKGIARLPWSAEQNQRRGRVQFLRRAEGDVWPDLGDEALAAHYDEWLAPFVLGLTSRAEITSAVLEDALNTLIPYSLARRLDDEAPTHFTAPTGNRFAIDYDAEGGPRVEVRVQEVFGLTSHPHIAGGRIALTLALLSPAHRPIQITRDLPSFWAGSWADVKTDMKGRYPRHVWPDDPAHTNPTARAKPRGT
jgi:ATP-dependent helicase HrpB